MCVGRPTWPRRSNYGTRIVIFPFLFAQRFVLCARSLCTLDVYDLQQSQRILETGKKLFQQAGNCRADSDSSPSSHSPYRGPDIAFHGDELADSGSAQLAAQLHARSISHMEYSNSTGIGQMGGLDGGRPGKVAAILCPTTCYLLRLPKPSVRTMIGTGVPVVIATDYNPNAMCEYEHLQHPSIIWVWSSHSIQVFA